MHHIVSYHIPQAKYFLGLSLSFLYPTIANNLLYLPTKASACLLFICPNYLSLPTICPPQRAYTHFVSVCTHIHLNILISTILHFLNLRVLDWSTLHRIQHDLVITEEEDESKATAGAFCFPLLFCFLLNSRAIGRVHCRLTFCRLPI